MKGKIALIFLLIVFGLVLSAIYYTFDNQIRIKNEIIIKQALELQNKSEKIQQLIKAIKERDKKIMELQRTLKERENELKIIESQISKIEENLTKVKSEIEKLSWNYSQWVYIAGVHDGEGAILILEGELKIGTGKVLVDLENAYLDVSFQESLNKALRMINKVFSKTLSGKDLILRVRKPGAKKRILIEGKSAGVAIAVLLYALLENKEINKSVVVTGAIDENGNVGKVGGIEAKAEAAAKVAKLFLVPKGQKPFRSPIEVKEISTIHDAIKYMIIEK